MTALVLDASIAVTWLTGEPGHETIDKWMRSDDELHAPKLMLVEAANALSMKALRDQFPPDGIETALGYLQSIGIRWTPDETLIAEAARQAVRLRHPVYDCLYLALAQQLGATLATDDRRLAALAAGLTPRIRVRNSTGV